MDNVAQTATPTAQTAEPQTAPQSTPQAEPQQTAPQAEPQPEQTNDISDGWFDGKEGEQTQDQTQDQKEELAPKVNDPLDEVPADGAYKFFDENGKEIPAEDVSSMSDAFKEAGLTQRQANTLKAKYDESVKNVAQEVQRQNMVAWADMAKGWKEEVIADREFGGDNLEQSKAYVSRALNTFGDDDLKSFVKEGFGFRPSLFKLLARTGKMLSDDRFVKGSQVHEESAYERNKRRYPKSPELWGSPDQ